MSVIIPIYSGIADMGVLKVINRESRKVVAEFQNPGGYSYIGMETNGVVTCTDSSGKDITFEAEKILKPDFDLSKIVSKNN